MDTAQLGAKLARFLVARYAREEANTAAPAPGFCLPHSLDTVIAPPITTVRTCTAWMSIQEVVTGFTHGGDNSRFLLAP
jgi:hypothetical protein